MKKKFRKQTKIRIKNIHNDIFKNLKKSKITSKTPKTQKI